MLIHAYEEVPPGDIRESVDEEVVAGDTRVLSHAQGNSKPSRSSSNPSHSRTTKLGVRLCITDVKTACDDGSSRAAVGAGSLVSVIKSLDDERRRSTSDLRSPRMASKMRFVWSSVAWHVGIVPRWEMVPKRVVGVPRVI